MADQSFSIPGGAELQLLDGGGLERDSSGRIRVSQANKSTPTKTKLYNNSGGALVEGDLLYVDTWSTANDCRSVKKAICSSRGLRAQFIADEAVAGATTFDGVTEKILENQDTSAGANGDAVFTSATAAGGWTRTNPATVSDAYDEQNIGTLVNAHATTGRVDLRIPSHDRAASTVEDARLAGLGATRRLGARDVGRAGTKGVYLTGVAAEGETVSIGARTYEFDTNAAVGPGNVRVDISADQTADAATTALAAAINADASRVADAVVWSGNDDTTSGIHLIQKSVTGANVAVSVAGINLVVLAAATTGALAIARGDAFKVARTITAADVTALARVNAGAVKIGEIDILGSPVTSQPSVWVANLKRPDGSSNFSEESLVTVKFRWVQVNTNNWMLKCLDPIGVLAADDVIHVIALS